MSQFKMDSKMVAIILLHHISITLCDKNTNKIFNHNQMFLYSLVETISI